MPMLPTCTRSRREAAVPDTVQLTRALAAGALSSVFLFVSAPTVHAAQIEIGPSNSGAFSVVTIVGDFLADDIESFRTKVGSVTRAIVVFESNGGSLLAGIRIGTLIRMKNYYTLVPDGSRCASACAVAWLGGTSRFMGAQAEIGFHAAYKLEAGQANEVGTGNAVLGAYLGQLGLSEDAIVYITKAPPSSMTWLTVDQAPRYGIEVSPFAEARPAVAPAAAVPAPPQQRGTISAAPIPFLPPSLRPSQTAGPSWAESTWQGPQPAMPAPSPAPSRVFRAKDVPARPEPRPPVDPRMLFPDLDDDGIRFLLHYGDEDTKKQTWEAIAPKFIEDRDGNLWEYRLNGQPFIVRWGRNR